MDKLELTSVPVMRTGMLIRKSPAAVFEAFVDPGITTKFWFTKGSGRLEVGRPAQWTWEMYDVSATVMPKVITPNERIVIEWPGYSGQTTVEWTFKPLEGGTFVEITESGFTTIVACAQS